MARPEHEISPVGRSKERAKHYYDRLSSWYDLLAARSERKYTALGLERLAVCEGDRVLEIGFGTGESLVSLALSAGSTGKVSGVDLSDGMRRVAAAKAAAAGLADRVDLKQQDAARLPFPDEAFDRVFISFTLELFDTPEIPIVLAECGRVLRAAGEICVVGMSKQGGRVERLYEWAHRHFPVLVDCRPIFVRQAVVDAGFEILDATNLGMWGLGVEIVLARKTLH